MIASRNAALSVAIRRFYYVAAFAFFAAFATPAAAQPAARPPLGSSITVTELGWLPAAGNLFSLLDTAVPDVIADRIDTGGLSAGEAARTGAHGSTWSQTIFTLGSVDITDPRGTGKPLLLPGVTQWERVDVSTGILPTEQSAPGLEVTLLPRPPGDRWLGSLTLTGSPPALNAKGDVGKRPSIARLNSWLQGNIVAGGPLPADKLGLFTTIDGTRSTHFERASTDQIDSDAASAFVSLVATPAPTNQLRLIGWFQRTRTPVQGHGVIGEVNAGEVALAGHGQVAWNRQLAGGEGLHLFGGFTARRRTNDLVPTPFAVVERLRDGPVPDLLDAGPGVDRLVSAGARFYTRSAGKQQIVGGVDVIGAGTTMQSSFGGVAGELIDGIPARIWAFLDPPAESVWRSLNAAAFIGDTIAIAPRVTIDGALRFETVDGWRRGAAAAHAVAWRSLMPRAGASWMMVERWQLSAFGQYSRYGHRLPLGDLAYGDPSAPTGSIYRWNVPTGGPLTIPAVVGPVVQRIGPGTGGDPAFSAIDPSLHQPIMDEAILGVDARPAPWAFVRLAAIGRREHHLVGVADVGVPASTYTPIGVPDPGVDLEHSNDDQTLFFFNRSPATFGADRYLLTNPEDDETSFVGAELTLQVRRNRGVFLAGITAGRSEGLSANRGFGPLENDAAILGEVYIDPNAKGHAQGRLFTERGYTIKFATAGQLGAGFEGGFIARYQDGQHFARMVIMEGLNQGAEAVRAFRNGRTRFTFSMTVDARLQKTFGTNGRIAAILDAYNLANQALEVEEFSVTGATSRLTSAVQPPRVVQLGIRFAY